MKHKSNHIYFTEKVENAENINQFKKVLTSDFQLHLEVNIIDIDICGKRSYFSAFFTHFRAVMQHI